MAAKLSLPFFSRLKKRERVFVLLALATMLIYFLAVRYGLPQLQSLRLGTGLLEDKERVLQGYLDAIDKEKVLKMREQAIDQARASYDSHLLKGEKTTLAATEVQLRIKDLAQKYGLDISSEKIASAVPAGPYQRIPVEITANGSLEDMRDFLYEIESGEPLLVVPQVTMRVSRNKRFNSATKKYEESVEMQTTLSIAGFSKG